MNDVESNSLTSLTKDPTRLTGQVHVTNLGAVCMRFTQLFNLCLLLSHSINSLKHLIERKQRTKTNHSRH